MPFPLFENSNTYYQQIPEGEGAHDSPPRFRKDRRRPVWIAVAISFTISLACAYSYWYISGKSSIQHATCSNPTTRREWRTLTIPQRHEYLSAVQCLKTHGSRIGENHTLYDDFPWIHSRVGAYVHEAAPFVAWHRYFVHIYESTLRESCEYTGAMPFWNWQLDWQDVTKAPVWNSEHGFGTTGHPDPSVHAIVGGYCLHDGPFKDLVIPYLDERPYPHCLSRGFLEGNDLKNKSMMISPEIIEGLLAYENYENFNLGLENGPHLAIPRSIRGDFSLLTAPSDPVFFLHHAQLDRLWWKWQKMSSTRSSQYQGVAAHGNTNKASVDDLLLMGGLAPDIPVSHVLDTEGDFLCYRY